MCVFVGLAAWSDLGVFTMFVADRARLPRPRRLCLPLAWRPWACSVTCAWRRSVTPLLLPWYGGLHVFLGCPSAFLPVHSGPRLWHLVASCAVQTAKWGRLDALVQAAGITGALCIPSCHTPSSPHPPFAHVLAWMIHEPARFSRRVRGHSVCVSVQVAPASSLTKWTWLTSSACFA